LTAPGILQIVIVQRFKKKVNMFSYWAYVLVGENDTGKTTFQRHLVHYINGRLYENLPSNRAKTIRSNRFPRAFGKLFIAGRSYEELGRKYKTLEDYFERAFKQVEICFLSTHSERDIAGEMIRHLRRRGYNVGGVFWSNSWRQDNGPLPSCHGTRFSGSITHEQLENTK
jgi:hypothetical protein